MESHDSLRVTRAKKRLLSEDMESNSRPCTPIRETRSRKNSTSTPDMSHMSLRSTPDAVISSPARRTTRRTSVNTNALAEVAKPPIKFPTLVEEETANSSSDENKIVIKIKEEPADEIEQPTVVQNSVADQPKLIEHLESREKAKTQAQISEPAAESNTEKNLGKTDKGPEPNNQLGSANEAQVEKAEKEPQEVQVNKEKEAQVATGNHDSTPKKQVEQEAVDLPQIIPLESKIAAEKKKDVLVRIQKYKIPKVSTRADAISSNDEHHRHTSGVEHEMDTAENMKSFDTVAIDATAKDTNVENGVEVLSKKTASNGDVVPTAQQNRINLMHPVVAESNPLKESEGESEAKNDNNSLPKNDTTNGAINEADGHKVVVTEVISLEPLNQSVIERVASPISITEKVAEGDKSVSLRVDEKNDGALNLEDKEKMPSNKNDTLEDIFNKSLPRDDYSNLSYVEEAGQMSIVTEMPMNQSVISITSSPIEVSKKEDNEDKTVSFKVAEKGEDAEKTVYPRTPYTSKIKVSVQDLDEPHLFGGNNSLDPNSTLDMMRKEAGSKNTPFRAKLSAEVSSSTPISMGNEDKPSVDGMSLRSGKKYNSPLSSPVGANNKEEMTRPSSAQSSPVFSNSTVANNHEKEIASFSKVLTSPQSTPVPSGVNDKKTETTSSVVHGDEEKMGGISKGPGANDKKPEEPSTSKQLASVHRSPVTSGNGNDEKAETSGKSKRSASPQSLPVTGAGSTKNEESISALSFPKSWSHCVEGKSGPESKIDRIKSLSNERARRYESDDNEEETDGETNAGSLEREEDMNEEDALEAEDDLEVEDNEDYEKNSLVDDEAEEIENYCSGDSLAESERREMEENEICETGVSLGSVDTEESHEEEDSDLDSFVVSDASSEQTRSKKNFKRIQPLSDSTENSDSTVNATQNEKELNNNLREEKTAQATRQESIEERLIYQADSSNETEAQNSPKPAGKEKNLQSIVTSASDEDSEAKGAHPFSHSLSFQRQTEYSSPSENGDQESEIEKWFEKARTLSRKNASLVQKKTAWKNASLSEQIGMEHSGFERKMASATKSPKVNEVSANQKKLKTEMSKSPNVSGIKQHTTAVSASDAEEVDIPHNFSNSAKSPKNGHESISSDSAMEFEDHELSKVANTSKKSLNNSTKMEQSEVGEEEQNPSKNGLPEEFDEIDEQSTTPKTNRLDVMATSLVLPHNSDMKTSTERKRKSAGHFSDGTVRASDSFIEAVQHKRREIHEKEEREQMSKKRKRSSGSGSFLVQESSPNAETKLADPQPQLKKVKTGEPRDENSAQKQMKSVKKILDYCDAVLDAKAKAKLEEKSKNKKIKKKKKQDSQDKQAAEEAPLAPVELGPKISDKQKKTAQDPDSSQATTHNEKVKAAVEHALKASLKIRLEGLGDKKNVRKLVSDMQLNSEEHADENAEKTQQQGEKAAPSKEKIVRKIKKATGIVSESEISEAEWPQPQQKTSPLQVPSASGNWLEDLCQVGSKSGLWLEEPPMKRIASGLRWGQSEAWLSGPFSPTPVRRIASRLGGIPREICSATGLWLEESASLKLISRHAPTSAHRADMRLKRKRKRTDETYNVLSQPVRKVARASAEGPRHAGVAPFRFSSLQDGTKLKQQKSNPVMPVYSSALELKQQALRREGVRNRAWNAS